MRIGKKYISTNLPVFYGIQYSVNIGRLGMDKI